MPRPTKLTPQLQSKIVKLLKTGVTVTDACASTGIHKSTFYDWIERGEAGDEAFADFSDAVSRAHVNAKVVAIGTLRTAMSPYNQTTRRTETFTETRFNRQGEQYEYKRETVTKTITRMQGDWRAAVEYLKRRFPDEWADHLKVEDWRTQAIADIRAGRITPEMFPEVVRAFDRATAEQLFAEAGISVMSEE